MYNPDSKGFYALSAFFLYTLFYLDVKDRSMDTEKLLAYQAVSRPFLSMWPQLVIHMPGITESWRLSSL